MSIRCSIAGRQILKKVNNRPIPKSTRWFVIEFSAAVSFLLKFEHAAFDGDHLGFLLAEIGKAKRMGWTTEPGLNHFAGLGKNRKTDNQR